VSVPFVLKVSAPEVKGSEISGLLGLKETFDTGDSGISFEKGWEDRRRIAWAIVGWKGPPCCEYADRCVGRTWPNVKNVDNALF